MKTGVTISHVGRARRGLKDISVELLNKEGTLAVELLMQIHLMPLVHFVIQVNEC